MCLALDVSMWGWWLKVRCGKLDGAELHALHSRCRGLGAFRSQWNCSEMHVSGGAWICAAEGGLRSEGTSLALSNFSGYHFMEGTGNV